MVTSLCYQGTTQPPVPCRCPLPSAPPPRHTGVLWGRGTALLGRSPSSPGRFPFQSPEGIGGSGGHLASRPERQRGTSRWTCCCCTPLTMVCAWHLHPWGRRGVAGTGRAAAGLGTCRSSPQWVLRRGRGWAWRGQACGVGVLGTDALLPGGLPAQAVCEGLQRGTDLARRHFGPQDGAAGWARGEEQGGATGPCRAAVWPWGAAGCCTGWSLVWV